MASEPTEHTPPCPVETGQAVPISEEDALSVLSVVETAYEAAWQLSDVGRIYFGPFEGLPRALRILREIRDEFRERAA